MKGKKDILCTSLSKGGHIISFYISWPSDVKSEKKQKWEPVENGFMLIILKVIS